MFDFIYAIVMTYSAELEIPVVIQIGLQMCSGYDDL